MKIFFAIILFGISTGMFSQDTTLVCLHDDLEVASLSSLNTKSIEFSPVFYGNGLVFVVARERNSLLDPKTGQAFFDLMYADAAPDGTVTRPVSFSPNIQTQYHEGPCTFNADASEIFFTRSKISRGTNIKDVSGHVVGTIFRGVKGKNDWENIEELPFSSDAYTIAYPALNAEGNRLVFASDMPGGFGGMDLYVVERINGSWQTPVNLGAAVNSKGNDVFPFWHELGYLFYSSDGKGGHGGLDLYVARWNANQTFRNVQHLLFPFNSSKDDLSFIVADDGRSGYFASNRKPTKGKDDLYRWSGSESIFCTETTIPPLMESKEILVTNDSGDAVPQAYIWMIPMDQEGPSLHKEHFTTDLVPNPDKPGSFYLRWGVIDTLSTKTADAVSGTDGRTMVNVEKTGMYAVVVQHNDYKPYVAVIESENIPAYIRLIRLPDSPVNCFNTLFTVFNDGGNIRLSGAQLSLTGPCLSKPIILTANQDGNAAGCLPAGCAVKAEIMHTGYAPHSFTFSPAEEDEHWTIYLKSGEHLTAPPSPIATGTLIVLDNIYYDFNKSEIRKSDAGELTALANILKQYPDLTIELTSHTDTRGTSEYNLELSRRRSESSKNYLMLLGISGSRINTKAAGETMPRNECVDGVECSEAQHQYNRRTEVRITNPAQGMEVKYKAQGG